MTSARIESSLTRRFADPWVPVALAATGLIFLVGIASLFSSKPLLRQRVRIPTGETARLEPIAVRPGWGALQIEIVTRQPNGSWAIYEIQVLDRTGKPIASGIKETRKRSSRLTGQGSGARQQEDLTGGLDLRIDKPQSLTLAIAVLEAGFAPGQTNLEEPIQFRVTARQGVIDGRYLWVGAIGCGVLALLAALSQRLVGALVIDAFARDSEVRKRAVVGGRERLVRVSAKIEFDETVPSETFISLQVANQYGECVYDDVRKISTWSLWERETTVKRVEWLLVLSARQSYRFAVEVAPDGPVEQTLLQVRDGASTAISTRITTVTATES